LFHISIWGDLELCGLCPPKPSDVAKGGAVRPWRHFYGGGTMGDGAVGYKPAKAVLK